MNLKKILLFTAMIFLLSSTNNAQPYKIGDNLNGGIVFDVSINGMSGLVVDTKDMFDVMTWFDAVEACKSRGEGWYLPNRDEIKKLYPELKMVGRFAKGNYWCSSDKTASVAWFMNFNNGTQGSNNKAIKLNVRAIWAF